MSDDIKYAIVGRELHKIVNGIDTGTDPDLTIEWNTTPLLPPIEAGVSQDRSIFATFEACPQCDGGEMRPEHAHWRCTRCGWRDSCCDL